MLIIIEKKNKREEYLLKLFENDGYKVCVLDDTPHGAAEKVYIMSLASAIEEDWAKKLEPDCTVFARDASEYVIDIFKEKDIAYHNYNLDEEFAIKNAYITAEGALSYIIQNTDIALIELKALILGYGRLGKAMCKVLQNNKTYTAVATNSQKELSVCAADKKYALCEVGKEIMHFDVIINTIPSIILKGEILNLIDKECFILDLASIPGGMDYNAAVSLNLKFMHALGVPGKTAPLSAAKYLKESIIKSLKIR